MTGIDTSLVGRMIRFQSELNRLDERLEINANNGHTVASATAARLASVAENLSTLADEFGQQAPEHAALASSLGQDAIEAAKYAGRLKLMSSNGASYAGYWGTVLDRPIANVHAAVGVLIGGPAPTLPKNAGP